MAALILVVRHAKAGHRTRWQGDDRERPLTAKGHRQATALVETLRPFGPSWLASSPYLRCRQTLAPLAATLGLPIAEEPALAEGNRIDALLAVGRAAPEPAACLCTHGDLIEELLSQLVAQGTIERSPALAEKAGSWVLELAGDAIRGARYLSPPG
jgi:phosphohistidine phosphatase SixA